MRPAVWCFVALQTAPLFAQQKPASSPAKPSAPALTAEGYRDLIVNIADAMSELGTYGQLTPGTGSEYVNGR